MSKKKRKKNLTLGVKKHFRSPKQFDPEGSGFDISTAVRGGMRRDASGHMGSIDPRTGQLLKGRRHPTIHKTIQREIELGHTFKRGRGGRFFLDSPAKKKKTKKK